MYRILCLPALLLALSACSSDQNFAECIIQNMPGTSSDQIRGLVHSECRTAHPHMYYEIAQGSGRGITGYSDERECTIALAKETSNQAAVVNIRQACSCLYSKPSVKDQRCAYPKTQFDPSTARPVSQYKKPA